MIELLAPAGDLEKFKIAIEYGADAVYFGGEIGGLRAAAGNLSIEEIKALEEVALKASEAFENGTVTGVITGGKGADSIDLGDVSGLKLAFAAGDSGTFVAPGDADPIVTTGFDVITGLAGTIFSIGDYTDATQWDGIDTGAITPGSVLQGLTVDDNTFALVRGTYTEGTFEAGEDGEDGLLVYDSDSEADTTALEAVVLVGVTNAELKADGTIVFNTPDIA